MGETWSIEMDDRGRLVVPKGLREKHGWEAGSTLIVVESERGVTLIERQRALDLIYEQLQASHPESMVDELIAERRAEAAREDAES